MQPGVGADPQECADGLPGQSDSLLAVETLAPVRERTGELLDDPAELERLLSIGADAASAIAEQTIKDVYDRIGFLRR